MKVGLEPSKSFLKRIITIYKDKVEKRKQFYPSQFCLPLLDIHLEGKQEPLSAPRSAYFAQVVIGGSNTTVIGGHWINGDFKVAKTVTAPTPGSLTELEERNKTYTKKQWFARIAELVKEAIEDKNVHEIWLSMNYTFPQKGDISDNTTHKLTIQLEGTNIILSLEKSLGKLLRSAKINISKLHDSSAGMLGMWSVEKYRKQINRSNGYYHIIVGTGFGGGLKDKNGTLVNIEPGMMALPFLPPFNKEFGLEKLVSGVGLCKRAKEAIGKEIPAQKMALLVSTALKDHKKNSEETKNLHNIFKTSAGIVAAHFVGIMKGYEWKSLAVSYTGSIIEKNRWYRELVKEYFEKLSEGKLKLKFIDYQELLPCEERGTLYEAFLRFSRRREIERRIDKFIPSFEKLAKDLNTSKDNLRSYAIRMLDNLLQNIEPLVDKKRGVAKGIIMHKALILLPDKYVYSGTSFKWDTEIILNLFSRLYPKLATEIYLTRLFYSQREDGMIPHILFNTTGTYYFAPSLWAEIGREGDKIHYEDGITGTKDFFTSGITQPMIFGFSRIIRKEVVDKTTRKQFIKQLHSYLKWAFDTSAVNSMFVSIHPWELGIDNGGLHTEILKRLGKEWKKNGTANLSSVGRVLEIRKDIELVPGKQRPANTSYLLYISLVKLYQQKNWNRKALVKTSPWRAVSPMMNALLVKSAIEVAQIAKNERLPKTTRELLEKARRVYKGMQNKMWNAQDRTFYPYALTKKGKIVLKVNTLDNFLPFIINRAELGKMGLDNEEVKKFSSQAKKAIESHLFNKEEYWKNEKYPYFLTSLPKNSPYFDEDRYWQAPVWPHMNDFVREMLKNWGYEKEAKELQRATLEMMLKHDSPSEYYNPRTGKKLGSPEGFSWAASTFLRLLKNHPV